MNGRNEIASDERSSSKKDNEREWLWNNQGIENIEKVVNEREK